MYDVGILGKRPGYITLCNETDESYQNQTNID